MSLYTLIPLDELNNEIISELPGLSSSHAKQVILQATNRFLAMSSVWRLDVYPEILPGNIAVLVPPKCALIHHYRDVNWCKHTGTVGARYFDTTTPYELHMRDTPTDFAVGDLKVTLVLKMARNSEEIPDYILDVHYDAIRAAALARLLMEPAKPYSDTQLGTYYDRKASAGRVEAKDVAERGYGRNEQNWRYPEWA